MLVSSVRTVAVVLVAQAWSTVGCAQRRTLLAPMSSVTSRVVAALTRA